MLRALILWRDLDQNWKGLGSGQVWGGAHDGILGYAKSYRVAVGTGGDLGLSDSRA
ncbi:ornithine decarboxylase antizyme 1, isoform CRA_b [Rattus norvegicus]|uniref:Ornithine decarboxylase antizyme 1, isoform CRA_b n=1 Tax=Rattus norvegicus TaxID=10116 RepID=A6K8F6_RAT|nr:ornithine decarboxylase antizyme 1, isoform CRA_b [Rattus norvegicus]EDL89225.1 ornithine decarboxylase antizyme 1, isoform CRA_b [Rattus norvegicus]